MSLKEIGKAHEALAPKTPMSDTPENQKSTTPRGFARLSPEARKLVAAKGGRAVPPSKRAFSQNPALAPRAGKKGRNRRRPKHQSIRVWQDSDDSIIIGQQRDILIISPSQAQKLAYRLMSFAAGQGPRETETIEDPND